jgi:predicted O-methyltransferase YrrM
MIRHFKPKRIIEIGSGYSTRLSAQAILKNREINASYECELTAIEPYPSEVLRTGFPGLSRLITDEVQSVSLAEFEKLEEKDILFIDSSHVLCIGSDVQYEILDILPRLKKGVIVHFHDIFFPLEYHQEWVLKEMRFWSEQYLLQAFLMFNDSFKVLWTGAYMILNHPDIVANFVGSCVENPYASGSFWMQKKK